MSARRTALVSDPPRQPEGICNGLVASLAWGHAGKAYTELLTTLLTNHTLRERGGKSLVGVRIFQDGHWLVLRDAEHIPRKLFTFFSKYPDGIIEFLGTTKDIRDWRIVVSCPGSQSTLNNVVMLWEGRTLDPSKGVLTRFTEVVVPLRAFLKAAMGEVAVRNMPFEECLRLSLTFQHESGFREAGVALLQLTTAPAQPLLEALRQQREADVQDPEGQSRDTLLDITGVEELPLRAPLRVASIRVPPSTVRTRKSLRMQSIHWWIIGVGCVIFLGMLVVRWFMG